jgi:type I restriction enzyme S subunit
MELKSGFKQSTVGVIPVDWDVLCIRDLLKHGPKNGYSGRSNGDIGGTPTLSLAATTKGRLVLNDATVKYLEQRVPADSSLYLEPGDVLVQRSNTSELVGTTAIFDGPAETFVYPDLMMRLRFKQPATGDWFWRYANSRKGRSFFRSIAAGSTGSMPKISGEKLRDMPVPLPPLAEQEMISEVLGDTDTFIDSLEQLIAKKQHLKQATIRELLTGSKRLPGFEARPGFKQTEAGRLPEDWGVDNIDHLAQITTGGKNTQDRIDDGQYPFFVRSQMVERINSYSYDGEAVLTAGDGVGTGKVFHYINGKFDAHQRVYRISEFSDRVNGYFFYLYFSSHFYNRIMQMTAKSSVDSVRREMIAGMLVPLPPTKDEQTAIAAILSDMDAEINTLEHKLVKIRQLKQVMTQELLTGRIRLVGPSKSRALFVTKANARATSNDGHNLHINEAVVIAALVHRFGSEQYPLGRLRRMKLSYLLHRRFEGQTVGYEKKAAGPYNPGTRYGGAEKIALGNRYVRQHRNGNFDGFIAGEKIAQAEAYFEKWYGAQVLNWLEQFRLKSNNELELITTVDMAVRDLCQEGKPIEVATVKQVIHDHPEWEAKLERAIFSDDNIGRAIKLCQSLFRD